MALLSSFLYGTIITFVLVNLVAGYCAVTATQAKRAKKKGHNLLFLAMLRHSEMLVSWSMWSWSFVRWSECGINFWKVIFFSAWRTNTRLLGLVLDSQRLFRSICWWSVIGNEVLNLRLDPTRKIVYYLVNWYFEMQMNLLKSEELTGFVFLHFCYHIWTIWVFSLIINEILSIFFMFNCNCESM